MAINHFFTGLYARINRFLFGPDIFISYSRSDAEIYAERLAIVLQQKPKPGEKKKTLRCYIDKWDAEPGGGDNERLMTALKNSSVFVLLATRNAVASKSVGSEVKTFLTTKRTIVPINFGYTHSDKDTGERTLVDSLAPGTERIIRKAAWFKEIDGLPITDEKLANLQTCEPSDSVLKRIENSFIYHSQSKRLRRAAIITTIILSVLSALIIYSTNRAIVIQKHTDSLAQAQTQLVSNVHDLEIRNQDMSKLNEQSNKRLVVLNDSIRVAGTNLEEARANLTEAVAKEKIARNQSLVFDNLSKASYYDIRNLPLQSYVHSLNAYRGEDKNSHGLSSLFISKALNRGVPKEIPVGGDIFELGIIDDRIYCLSTGPEGKSKITSFHKDGSVIHSTEGLFTTMTINKKREEILAGEYSKADSGFLISVFTKDLQPTRSVRLKPVRHKATNAWEKDRNYKVTYLSELKASPSGNYLAISGYAYWADISNAGYRCRIYMDAPMNFQYSELYTKNDFESIHEQSELQFVDDHEVLSDGREEIFIDDIRTQSRQEIGRHKEDSRNPFIETYDCNPSKTKIAMGGFDNSLTILRKAGSKWQFEKVLPLPGDSEVERIQFLDDNWCR